MTISTNQLRVHCQRSHRDFASKLRHQHCRRPVPPRGSGWVEPTVKNPGVCMPITDPPATAWWYWPHSRLRRPTF